MRQRCRGPGRCQHHAWSHPHSCPATRDGPKLCDEGHRSHLLHWAVLPPLTTFPFMPCDAPTHFSSSLHSTEGRGQQGEITPMKEKLEPRPEGTISSVGGNELQGDPRPRRPPALKVEAGSKSISMGSGPSNPPSMVRFSCASPLASLFCTHTVDTCSQRPFRSSPHSCKMSPLLLHPLSYRLCY